MFKERIGTVVRSRAIDEFDFIVKEDMAKKVFNNSYVILKHPNNEEWFVLARIVKLREVASIKIENIAAALNISTAPFTTVLLGKCNILGCYNKNGKPVPLPRPVKLGQEVWSPSLSIMQKFFVKPHPAFLLGYLSGLPDVPVHLSYETLCKVPILITGMTGSGKTTTAASLVYNINKSSSEVTCIVYDLNREYAHKLRNATKIAQITPGKDFSMEMNLELINTFAELEFLTETQISLLMEIFQKYGGKSLAYLRELDFRELGFKSTTAVALIRRIERLISNGLLSEKKQKFPWDASCLIVDLSCTPIEYQKMMVDYITKLAISRVNDREISKLFIVIEEAHRFIPERQLASPMLKQILFEGPRSRTNICLVTSKLSYCNNFLLSASGFQIIHRITNVWDLDTLFKVSEFIDNSYTRKIQHLSTGEAIICGADIPFPTFVRIRPPNRG